MSFSKRMDDARKAFNKVNAMLVDELGLIKDDKNPLMSGLATFSSLKYNTVILLNFNA